MRRYIQHEPFNIYCFEAKTWEHPVHNHTYFEIIFILKGKGSHTINGNTFKYRRGDVFLLGPADYHAFNISSITSFCYIRFLESFTKTPDNDKSWLNTLKLLLHTPFQSKGSIVRDDYEKQQLNHLLTVLRKEYDNRHDSRYEFMRDSVMKAILTILASNVKKQSLSRKTSSSANAVEEILLFIRQHIFQPQALRMENLCRNFNLAPSYISIYFKKHTGESLKQYITMYKIKLIEGRLIYSNASMIEIADEFGFNDESHLCKQFKKYNGIAPGVFRNQGRHKK